MTGPKNIDRSLKRMARKHVTEARKALKNLNLNKTVTGLDVIHEQVVDCRRRVEHLITLLAEKCKHCGKKVPFSCNMCAGCADERGP